MDAGQLVSQIVTGAFGVLTGITVVAIVAEVLAPRGGAPSLIGTIGTASSQIIGAVTGQSRSGISANLAGATPSTGLASASPYAQATVAGAMGD